MSDLFYFHPLGTNGPVRWYVTLTQQYDLVGYESVQYYNVTGLAQELVIAFSLSGQVRVFG